MKNQDNLISGLEERIKKAEEIKNKIDNPEPDRLLSKHRRLEEEYKNLMDDTTRLYQAAKKVLALGFKLVCRPDKNEIGFVQNYSPAGYPEISYANEGRFSWPVASGGKFIFIELTPEKFMEKIVKGDFKPLDHICMNCGVIVPYGKKICVECGLKI